MWRTGFVRRTTGVLVFNSGAPLGASAAAIAIDRANLLSSNVKSMYATESPGVRAACAKREWQVDCRMS